MNVNAMYTVVSLYCLESTDKKISLYVFSTEAIFKLSLQTHGYRKTTVHLRTPGE